MEAAFRKLLTRLVPVLQWEVWIVMDIKDTQVGPFQSTRIGLPQQTVLSH